jgi:trimethylamine--corrinoid protein Co-methyltransferase
MKNFFDIGGSGETVLKTDGKLSLEDTIHYATLDILQDTGIKVMSESAAELFYSSGSSIEKFSDHYIVKIPPNLVEESLALAPGHITYKGRNPHTNFSPINGSVAFTTFGGCIKIIDPITRQRRMSTKRDLEEMVRVCDYLDEISIANRVVNATDAPAASQSVHNMEAILKNTGKHFIIGADSPTSLKAMQALAAVSLNGHQELDPESIFSVSVCPVSPLVLPQRTTSIIIEAANMGIGIVIIPMALSGGTSPATLSGTLVCHNAEVLSCIVLAQLARRGSACTYGSTSTILDLKYGTCAVGSPEYAKINAAVAKLSKYYGLPCFVGGGCSDSKVPDHQSAYEFTLSATMTALTGADIIFGCGGIEQGLTMDYAKLIMDAEMVRMIMKAAGDISCDGDGLALDVIRNVGPGGSFLTHRHTLKHMHLQSRPHLFDRRTLEDWGSNNTDNYLLEQAYATAVDIIKTYTQSRLPAGVESSMAEIVQEFESEFGLRIEKQHSVSATA